MHLQEHLLKFLMKVTTMERISVDMLVGMIHTGIQVSDFLQLAEWILVQMCSQLIIMELLPKISVLIYPYRTMSVKLQKPNFGDLG